MVLQTRRPEAQLNSGTISRTDPRPLVAIVANQIEGLGLKAAISVYDQMFRVGPLITPSHEHPSKFLTSIDVVVISASYKGLEAAVHLASELRDSRQKMGIVGISQPENSQSCPNKEHAFRFLKAGANAYVPIEGDDDNPRRVMLGVQIAYMGGTYSSTLLFGREKLAALPALYRGSSNHHEEFDILAMSGQYNMVEYIARTMTYNDDRRTKLTPRHKDVVSLVLLGFENPEIADAMDLGTKSVENYINAIGEILGCAGRLSVRRLLLTTASFLQAADEVYVSHPHPKLIKHSKVLTELHGYGLL